MCNHIYWSCGNETMDLEVTIQVWKECVSGICVWGGLEPAALFGTFSGHI